MNNKTKILTAWIITLIMVAGTIAFIIIYKYTNKTPAINKYKALEDQIWNLIANKNFKSNYFDASVVSGVQESLINFDVKNDKVNVLKVLYQSSNNGNVGFIFEYMDTSSKSLITNVFNLVYNDKGIISSFVKVV